MMALDYYVHEVTAASRAFADEGVRTVLLNFDLPFDVEHTWQYVRTRDTVLVMVALAALDIAGVRLSGARYYILHFLINVGVVYCVTDDMLALLSDPIGATPDITHNPLPLIYGLHLYHCVAFSDLTVVDWMHHFINVLIMGIIAEGWHWGKGVNAVCWFMNGVPGGLDYLLLTLVKHGLMHTMTEKRINALVLNLLIRFPGMTVCAWAMVVCKLNGKLPDVPWWVIGAIIVLEWGNAAYFCQRVIGNYYVRDHIQTSKAKAAKQSNGHAAAAEESEEEEFH